MSKLIEDIIYKLPVRELNHGSYYKLSDLHKKLLDIDAEVFEICTCSLTPFYLDIHGTYEIYHQALELNLVNEPMFEKYIYMLFRKHSDEIAPYYE